MLAEAQCWKMGALYTQGDLRRLARGHPNIANLGPACPCRFGSWLSSGSTGSVSPLRFAPSARALSGKTSSSSSAATGCSRSTPPPQGPCGRWLPARAGSFVAEDQGTILTREGRSYGLLESVPRPRRVEFSPDERWLAVATGTSVYLVGTPRNLGFLIRLPIPAQDLVWEPGGPTIDTTTTVR